MSTKPIRIPDEHHPITITPNPSRIVVTVAGQVIADTRSALTLREAAYAPVYYIPRRDVAMTLLARSTHRSWCPYKGECAYFGIPAGGERSLDAAWSYETPLDAVAAIGGYLAFYPQRVDSIVRMAS